MLVREAEGCTKVGIALEFIAIELRAENCPLAVRDGVPNGESALAMSSSLQFWKSRELQLAR